MMHCGLRQASIRKLHITGDFSWTRPGQEGICHLHVPGEKVKNRHRVDRVLPSHVANMLRIYLAEYRPLRDGADGPYLFPGLQGGMRARSQFGAGITHALQRDAGLELTPHQIRHVIAKIVVERDADAYGAVSSALGHTSMQTTMTHYLGTEGSAAARHIDQLLNAAVAGSPVEPPPKRPRSRR